MSSADLVSPCTLYTVRCILRFMTSRGTKEYATADSTVLAWLDLISAVYYTCGTTGLYTCTRDYPEHVHILMRDERKKEASKVKQTKESNTAHPRQSLVHAHNHMTIPKVQVHASSDEPSLSSCRKMGMAVSKKFG